jgi:SSS family solute:Na+ symporter
MKLSSIDLAVVVLYLVVTLIVGWRCRGKEGTAREFSTGGGELPTWAVALSIFGTYVSSISFIALPGKAFASNWSAFTFSLSLPIAAYLCTRYFVPYYRKINAVSAYNNLENIYGPWARVYASFCYLLTQVARIGAVLFLLALPLNQLLGWDVRWIIIGTGALTAVYTAVGGISAVIYVDAIQSVLLISGALLCCVLLLFQTPGGPGSIFHLAMEQHKFSLGGFAAGVAKPTFWVVLVYGITLNLQNLGIDQSFVQRYLTTANEKEAKRSVWVGALLYLPVSAFFLFIGTALYVYYHLQPQLLPAALTAEVAAGRGDKVFPFFIVDRLPVGVTGMLIAAIFAAAMSAVSGSLNGAATCATSDLYRRHLRPNASDGEMLHALHGATVLWAMMGTGMALMLVHVQSALDAWWQLSGIFGGGMLGLFLLGYCAPKIARRGGLFGLLAGLAVLVWLTVSIYHPIGGGMPLALHPFLIPVFGTATILITGFCLGVVLRGRPALVEKV